MYELSLYGIIFVFFIRDLCKRYVMVSVCAMMCVFLVAIAVLSMSVPFPVTSTSYTVVVPFTDIPDDRMSINILLTSVPCVIKRVALFLDIVKFKKVINIRTLWYMCIVFSIGFANFVLLYIKDRYVLFERKAIC